MNCSLKAIILPWFSCREDAKAHCLDFGKLLFVNGVVDDFPHKQPGTPTAYNWKKDLYLQVDRDANS